MVPDSEPALREPSFFLSCALVSALLRELTVFRRVKSVTSTGPATWCPVLGQLAGPGHGRLGLRRASMARSSQNSGQPAGRAGRRPRRMPGPILAGAGRCLPGGDVG